MQVVQQQQVVLVLFVLLVLDLLDLYPLRSRIRAARLRGPTLLIETDDAVDFITLPPTGAD